MPLFGHGRMVSLRQRVNADSLPRSSTDHSSGALARAVGLGLVARELLDAVLTVHAAGSGGSGRSLGNRELVVGQEVVVADRRGGRGEHRVVGVLVQLAYVLVDGDLGHVEEVERGRAVALELGIAAP